MPNGDVIDSLSLEIGASVNKSISAIDQLQQHLRTLNSSLENFKDGGSYKRALDNLSSGFTNLGNSIKALDPDKITRVSASLKDLAKNASKLNNAFGSGSSYSKSMSDMNKELSEQGKELASTFGVTGAKNVEAVTQAFRELSSEIDSSGNKTSGYADKLENLVKIIQGSAGDVTGGIGESIAQQVRKYVSDANKSGSKIYLPFEPSEFSDDYRSMRATFGKMFTSDDLAFFEGAQDIASFAEEMNGALGNIIDLGSGDFLGSNEADIFRQIYDYLVQARDEQEKLTQAAQEYVVSEKDVANEVEALIPKMQALQTTISGEDSGGAGGINSLADSLKGLKDVTIPDFSNLKNLASSAEKLGGENATAAATNIPAIAGSLKSLDGVTIPDTSNLSALANAVSRLGSSNAQNASWVLPNIMAELESFSQHFSGLTIDANALNTIQQLGSAFSKLGGKNANEAIKTLPQLSDAIRQMVDDLNGLPEVSDKTQQLVVALGNLAKANGKVQTSNAGTNKSFNMLSATIQKFSGWVMKSWKNTNVLQSAINGLKSGINNFNNGMKSAKAHTESLTMAIVKVRTLIWGLKRVMSFFSGAIENASSLTEVQNVVANVYDPSYIEEFEKAAENTITTLGMSKLSFEQYASRYQAMGKAMGITNSQMSSAEDHLKSMGIEYGVATGKMGDMSVNLTRLAADMASFYDVSQEDVYTSLQAIYTGQTRPLMLAA